jgi:predicted nuclease of predicted toxin-antitoxin system
MEKRGISLIVDESTGRRLYNLLKESYDTSFVGDVLPGSADTKILELACREERTVITDDKDFGELVFRLKKPCKGIILLRMNAKDPQKRLHAIKGVLEKVKDLQNKFIVLEEKTARIRDI